jgi:small subunit ribosomal protein S13
MARIAGINLPNEKRVDVGLAYLYGVGRPLAAKILAATQVKPETRVKDLTAAEIDKIQHFIEHNYLIEGNLRRDIGDNIKRLKSILCYRGIRHTKHLPVRGQRTKTNSRTVRGNLRRTVGGTKQAAAKKV